MTVVGEGVMIFFLLVSFVCGALSSYIWLSHRKVRYRINPK